RLDSLFHLAHRGTLRIDHALLEALQRSPEFDARGIDAFPGIGCRALQQFLGVGNEDANVRRQPVSGCYHPVGIRPHFFRYFGFSMIRRLHRLLLSVKFFPSNTAESVPRAPTHCSGGSLTPHFCRVRSFVAEHGGRRSRSLNVLLIAFLASFLAFLAVFLLPFRPLLGSALTLRDVFLAGARRR